MSASPREDAVAFLTVRRALGCRCADFAEPARVEVLGGLRHLAEHAARRLAARAGRGEAWRVELEFLNRAQPWRSDVFDAATGGSVGRQFPATIAPRLLRSLDERRPVTVRLLCADGSGNPYVRPDGGIATRLRRVLVVGARALPAGAAERVPLDDTAEFRAFDLRRREGFE